MRESCSSKESHKSSVSLSHVSQRSSAEESAPVVVTSSAGHHVTSAAGHLHQTAECPSHTQITVTLSQPNTGTMKPKYGHARTPSSDKEKIDNGRISSAISSRFNKHKPSEEFSSEESRTPKSRGSGSFVSSGIVEDERLCKLDGMVTSCSSPDEKDKRSPNIYPSVSRIERVLGKDVSDEPIDFRALRQDIRQLEKETIRRRQEISKPGVDMWSSQNKVGSGISSGFNSGMSPALAYRSLRSLTPDDGDDSTSFHESFEKELIHRRRRRQRSASCSSRCCESDQCCRLDSCQSRSTHSVTGASSRNSSSRSDKSSTRSSRSPSIELIKQGKTYLMDYFKIINPYLKGCNSSHCRAKTSLR